MARLNKATRYLLIAGFFVLLCCHTIFKISCYDLWWHLKTGEYIVKTLSVPKEDIFSFTAFSHPWVAHSWLAEVVFYVIDHTFGINGLIIFKSLIVALTFLILIRLTSRLEFDLYLAIIVLLPVLFSATPRFLVRPDIFTPLFLAVFIYIIFSYKYLRIDLLSTLPILQIFWVNLHGGALIGIVILSVFILGELLQGKMDKGNFYKPSLITFLVILATFVNPNTYRVFLYPFEIAEIYLRDITEWHSSFRPYLSGLHFISYYKLLILFGVVSFILNFKRFDLTNAILFILFLYLSAVRVRFITLFAVTTSAILSINLRDLFIDKPLLKKLISHPSIGLSTLLLIAFFIYGVFNPKDRSRMFPAEFGFGVSKNFPMKAVDFINEIGLKGKIFTLYGYGGYVIYRCYPRMRVFIDGRNDVYGEEIYREYLAILDMSPGFEELIEKYRVDCFLLPHGPVLESPQVLDYLSKDERWNLVYFDDRVILYIKTDEIYKPILEKYAYQFIDPINPTSFEEEDIPGVIQEIDRSIKINPQSWFVHVVGGQIYRELGNSREAMSLFRKAREINPNIEIIEKLNPHPQKIKRF